VALADAIRDAALLEGDFVLRSGRRSSYYLDKYRFGTRPDLLRPLGRAIAEAVREHEPDAVRLAAPELGAVTLATAAALELDLPFVIVRSRAKEYGTANRIEGAFDHGDCVCLVEDVVTSGGSRPWRRSARPDCVSPTPFASSTARREASTRSPGRRSASVRSSGARSSAKWPQNRMVERYPMPLLAFLAKV
jgi:orotate phosphoribosyltransferase